MPDDPINGRTARAFGFAAAALALAVAATVALTAQNRHDFQVSAHKYAYKVEGSEKPEIRVMQGDLVHVTFSSEDIAHSFTISDYRIMKRADPGKPVVIEFVAEKTGSFPIHCTITTDSRCKELAATLIVDPKK